MALYFGMVDKIYMKSQKTAGLIPVFTASIWIAGYIENDLRGAASTFGPV